VLHELSITNVGVIDSTRITLGPGLTVLTGETGAGKTMVLTGLALVTGEKLSTGVVRTGADAAIAEAIVDVPAGSQAAAAFEDAGVLREEDDTVLISRTLAATTQARSRTVVGGRQIPQALLAQHAPHIVTVHGQSDQVRVRSRVVQRDMLDRFAGTSHMEIVQEHAAAWEALVKIREEQQEMAKGAEAERLAVANLKDDLAAIDDVNPEPGEDEKLAGQVRLLENSESVRTGVAQAREVLAGESDTTVVSQLAHIRRTLETVSAHDAELESLVTRVAEAGYALTDISSELARYLDNLEADPERLAELHQRRSDIAQLMRRLGRDLEGVLSFAVEARERVNRHDSWDETMAAHAREEQERALHVEKLSTRIREGRQRAAEEVAQAVNQELRGLAMPDAVFSIAVTPTTAGPSGADHVDMMLASHPGAPLRPVADAASGGELSRIMLALEVSLAQRTVADGHTFVFDEVDAGVGGRAASEVGARLARLAQTQQVVVVTHLAQVAAYADHHIVVHKDTDGRVTTSHVTEVAGEERIQEIARLLSGQEGSEHARAHARELLDNSAI